MIKTPAAPVHALYLSTVKYGVECLKYTAPLEQAASAEIAAHRTEGVRRRIAQREAVRAAEGAASGGHRGDSSGGSGGIVERWFREVLPRECETIRRQFPHRVLGQPSDGEVLGLPSDEETGGDLAGLASGGATNSSLSAAPVEYETVLGLLRDIVATGRWPPTSVARSKVIEGDPNNAADTVDVDGGGAVSTADAGDAGERGGGQEGEEGGGKAVDEDAAAASPPPAREGGSFSVGAMPDRLNVPRGNIEFPELVKAIFELERKLAPDRAPSSTCAVNCNAQFKPHRDSGAGAGQLVSLVVGLGDYGGGDLIVEGERHAIRYAPLAFDGWDERHWTMPFVGERFSLVWFTPIGCAQSSFLDSDGEVRMKG